MADSGKLRAQFANRAVLMGDAGMGGGIEA